MLSVDFKKATGSEETVGEGDEERIREDDSWSRTKTSRHVDAYLSVLNLLTPALLRLRATDGLLTCRTSRCRYPTTPTNFLLACKVKVIISRSPQFGIP